jgi:hypothetical protein
VASSGETDKSRLRRVVVVFKTHFDLGFTDLPERVMSLYTGPMFDAVRAVMRATDDQPPELRYRWTLPAWPMRFLLHSPSVPDQTQAKARRLVEEGRLAWHAWPFTTHTAFCGLEDLVRGLHISRSLSGEFGYWPVSAKQTDVPGHTWALPSLLFHAGVRFLHLGCNSGSHAPHVPRLFWWEGPDGSRVLTFYSAGGYGTSLLPPDDWPFDTWLALQHTVDNEGPQSAEELARMRETLAEQAPGAELVVGKLDDFYLSLTASPELSALPVVRYDLADTWIHGVGTMPREVARVRGLRARLLAVEIDAAQREWPGSDEVRDFPLARQIAPFVDTAYEDLMLFGEHTWGLDVKSTIKRVFGPGFEAARQTEPYKRLETSWDAKAAYVDHAEAQVYAAEGLLRGDSSAVESEAIVSASVPPAIAPAYVEGELENEWLRLAAGGGEIISLVDKRTGHEWVDKDRNQMFGGYRYDIYSARDIAKFIRSYGLYFQDWFVQDFGKTGYPEDSEHLTAWARGFSHRQAGPNRLLMEGGTLVSRKDEGEVTGAPDQRISIEISLPDDGPYVDLTYRIEGKVATPLAESAVVAFPLNLPKATFRLGQVGSVIDPGRDIAPGANRSLWCVDGWVDATDDRLGFGVIPLDMPLVSIGSVGIFEFEPERVPREPVVYSHLFNTQWGTNFRQWHEGDFSFRIRLVPHAGGWRTARLWESAHRAVYRPGRELATGAPSPVRLSDGLVLLAMRPRNNGAGLVVRFWDALGLPREGTIEVDGPVSALWHCDTMERPFERLDPEATDGGVRMSFPVEPHRVETLLIEFAEQVLGGSQA